MTGFFQKLLAQHTKGFPFAAYRKPKEKKITALLQKTKDTFFAENFTETGFVFAPFDSDEKALLIPLGKAEVFLEEFKAEQETEKDSLNENKIPAFAGMGGHIQLVKKGIAAIKAGNLQKVVLSRKQTLEIPEKNPLVLFEKLLNEYPTAFVYCWFHPTTGLWMGATPETLLKVENHHLKTVALAGTQKYNGTTAVSWGEKEKEEQQLVADAIVSSLKSKVGHLKISDTKTVQAGNLLHLKTEISGSLNNSNLQRILTDLHPTPAVCGLPKVKAKNFILENEGYDREFYTGFLGELNFPKNNTHLFVNLRCMQVEKNKANLFLGGGIVKDSDPEKEWEETLQKARTMLKVL